ncbi:hypothetical protein PVAP13_2NG353000 [Panicum virgatum]|uniref:Receptor-like serine/threonine-protein kinase n=1 Tax=Panicum virgatum TaxID=38727 RepID=A0A8T0VGM3_PANVG|nr:hypothetical protein PVAP13_2NG353000 [Panicum virgatum]
MPPPPPPAPPRALAFLGLVLAAAAALSAGGAVTGPLATELVRPSFVASNILYVDTGGAFLESKSGAFRAAVVNPGKQQGRFYLAVLHAPSATVVWSANRGAPTTSSGPVQLTAQRLTVSDPNGTVLWSTPSQLGSPVAALRLQDSGNLQLLGAGNATLWQSFDAATDTLLPGQLLRAGAYLAAAAGATDLAEGDYRLAATAADVVLTWQGSTYWRLSNDLRSFKDRNVAVASVSVNASGLFAVAADGGLVFRVDLAAGAFPVLKLGYDGRLRITGYPLVNSSASLGGDFVAPANYCDLPLQCPPLGLCSPAGNSSTCTCPPLFAASASTPGACVPGDGSALAAPASCQSNNSTAPVSYLALKAQAAYFATKFDPPTMAGVNYTACRGLCTGICACLAYFYDRSSRSCYLVREKQLGSLYLSSSASALGYIKTVPPPQNGTRNKSANRTVPIVLPSIAAFLLVAVIAWYACWRRMRKNGKKKKKAKSSGAKQMHMGRKKPPSSGTGNADGDDDADDDDVVVPGMPTRFSYAEIATMTGNFGTKIGSGGFGSVYKGELPGGEGLVAVKKLEAAGVQAKREFCTEITVIANLHTGCDQKIVHCDVKPENILLAGGGQVKIADFGLAKLMSPEQSALFTTMRGTRGYLAPEWISSAAISDRADVYSFGMVLLELIHGRKNRGEQTNNNVAVVGSGEELSGWSSAAAASMPRGASGSGDEYFPMVALGLHEQGRHLDIVDARLEGRVDEAEAARAVRIALCCLHEDPAQRPSMAAVVRMLEGTVSPPEPRVEALGFLRLYGRGYAAGRSAPTSSLLAMAGTSGSAGTPSSTAGASQLTDSLQGV